MRVVVACFGNVLRGDDGFGAAVARRLLDAAVPDGVRVVEVGIAGIHLVQELFDRVDGLVIVDAMDAGRTPGTVMVVQPDVPDVHALSLTQRHDALADMHYATPERAMLLARGLAVLPAAVVMVGCQAADRDRVGEGLSPPVAAGVDAAVAEVRAVVGELGVPWPPDGV